MSHFRRIQTITGRLGRRLVAVADDIKLQEVSFISRVQPELGSSEDVANDSDEKTTARLNVSQFFECVTCVLCSSCFSASHRCQSDIAADEVYCVDMALSTLR